MLEGKFLPSLIPREAATSTAMNRHHGPFFGRPPLLAAECEPYSPPVIFFFFFSGVKLSSLPSLSHLKSPPELGSIGRLAWPWRRARSNFPRASAERKAALLLR